MALTNTPTAKLDFTFKDASGSIGHMLVHVPYSTLAAEAITAADAIAAAMAALSDATVQGYTLTYAKEDTAPPAPNAGSRVEEKGVFVWRTANARSTRFTIPAIKDSVLNPSGSVNKSDVLVTALVDVVTGLNSVFAAADGSDITSLLEAYQRFNRSTRNQLPGDR